VAIEPTKHVGTTRTRANALRSGETRSSVRPGLVIDGSRAVATALGDRPRRHVQSSAPCPRPDRRHRFDVEGGGDRKNRKDGSREFESGARFQTLNAESGLTTLT
jgi:hypothetical protein